ncbi:MAG: NTP transferase domain-containing protein, partial [Actinomycetota bacterium]
MKPLSEAKARLAPALGPEERRRLSLAMLADVVDAARGFDRVWVLQSDDDAAAVAMRRGAEPRPDPAPGRGLNASLDAATADALAHGATGVLVVSADLAAARAEDLQALAGRPGVSLAPDRAGAGTNALWRHPP